MISTPLWRLSHPLVLASGSRTRMQMLAHAGIPLDCIRPDVNERELEQGLEHCEASTLSIELAAAKAMDVGRDQRDRLVLGADQVLDCEGRRFHKPLDRAGAKKQLLELSGRSHVLVSGYAIVRNSQVIAKGHAQAKLTMRRFSESFVDTYLEAAGEPILGSVGAYQVEALGSQLFADIGGDHFTILGLPLLPVLEELRRLGAIME